jgi:hypothetical protein
MKYNQLPSNFHTPVYEIITNEEKRFCLFLVEGFFKFNEKAQRSYRKDFNTPEEAEAYAQGLVDSALALDRCINVVSYELYQSVSG